MPEDERVFSLRLHDAEVKVICHTTGRCNVCNFKQNLPVRNAISKF